MIDGYKAEYGPPIESLFAMPSMLSYIVAILLGVAAYAVLRQRSKGTPDRIFLPRWFAIGFALRIIFCMLNSYIFINVHLIQYDTHEYTFLARCWTDYWDGLSVTCPELGHPYQIYGLWVAVQYWLTDNSQLAPYFTNAFIGSWLPIIAYQVVLERIGDHRAARFALILMIFEPDLIAWSGIVGHDIILTLLGALFVRDLIPILRRFEMWPFGRLLLWIVIAGLLRPYILAIFAATAAASVLIVCLKSPLQRLAFGVLIVSSVAVLAVSGNLTSLAGDVVNQGLQSINDSRYMMLGGGETAYMTYSNLRTPLDLLAFVPVGWVYLVFGPFPWYFHTLTHLVFLLPAVGFWYFGLVYGAMGASDLRKIPYVVVPLVAFFMFGTILYGMMSNTFQLGMRWRSQYVVAAGVLAAAAYSRRRRLPLPFIDNQETEKLIRAPLQRNILNER